MSRKLDELVATRVMGLPSLDLGRYGPPRYSTDIAAAWLVVEQMQERPGYRGLDLHHDTVSLPSHAWSCEFTVEHLRHHAFAPTQPLSIVLAALRALAVPEAEIASASAAPAPEGGAL